MATLDITSGLTEDVDTIWIAETDRMNENITHLCKCRHLGVYFKHDGSDPYYSLHVTSEGHAENIIKALQYAIEMGWWNE